MSIFYSKKKTVSCIQSMSRSSRINKPKPTPESSRPKARVFYASSITDAQNAKNEKKTNISRKEAAYTPKPVKLNYDQRVTRSLNKQPQDEIFSDNDFSEKSEKMSQKSPKTYEHTIVSCLTSKNRICSPEKIKKREENSDEFLNTKPTRRVNKKSPMRNTRKPAYEEDSSNFISLEDDTETYSTQTSEEPIATFRKTVKVARKSDYMSNQLSSEVDAFFLTENDLYKTDADPFENQESQSSLFISELQPEINSSIQAQRNDTISYTTVSSFGSSSYRKTGSSRRSTKSKRSESVFSSEEKTETDGDDSYHKMRLLGSDAIESIITTSTATQQQSEYGEAYFVSGESDLAPGQISAIVNEIEVSRSPPSKKSVCDDEEISLLPEDIGIWLI